MRALAIAAVLIALSSMVANAFEDDQPMQDPAVSLLPAFAEQADAKLETGLPAGEEAGLSGPGSRTSADATWMVASHRPDIAFALDSAADHSLAGGAPRAVEEVVVRARPEGDNRYEAALEQELIDEFDRVRAFEDGRQWRDRLPTAAEARNLPRFKWGYDPDDEVRRHNHLDSSGDTDLPDTIVQPGILLRFEF